MPATSVAIGGMTEVDEPPTLAEKRARDPTRTAESPQRPRNARSSPAPASIVIIFGGNREACRMRHEIIPGQGVRVRRRDLLGALLVTTAVRAPRADNHRRCPVVEPARPRRSFDPRRLGAACGSRHLRPNRSTALGGLGHEAPTQPVTRRSCC